MGGRINPVFPHCENDSKQLEPIVFTVPAKYNKKVMIHDWQMEDLAEPRDNTDFFPPKGHLRKSSYRRIGPENAGTGVSETQAMLSQIELKDQYKPIYPKRSLLTMHTFALADYEEPEEEKKLTDLLIDPEELRSMDYCTTSKITYKLPYPLKVKAPAPPPPPEPWLLNRRTIGYSLEQLENRQGFNTFLDDNMDLHSRISDLKIRRNKIHQLFDDRENNSTIFK